MAWSWRRSRWFLSGVQIAAGAFLLPLGNAIWAAVHDSNGKWTSLWNADWLIAVSIVAIALPVAIATEQRKLIGAKECTGLIKRLLEGLSQCYPQPNRTNIMLVCQTEKGARRKVDSDTAHNMAGDPDNELEIDINAGVSGEALIQGAYVWGDLTIAPQPGAPSWRLRPDEQKRVRPTLKTILSVPIVDLEDLKVPFGTLQVDSDLTVKEFLPDPKAAGTIAARFADVVALLLRERRR